MSEYLKRWPAIFSTESPFSVQYLFSTSATYKSLAKSFVSVLFLKKDDVNGI